MADDGLVSGEMILAGGAVALGFLLFQDLRSDPQAEYAREDLLPELRNDIEEEVDNPDELTEGELENHIQKWESVARSYYPLLEDEYKDSVPVPPSEFANRVENETDSRQEAALLWKGYAQGVLQAYLVQEGRPGFDRDDFAGMLWEIIKIALLLGAGVLSLKYIVRELLRHMREKPRDPDGSKESARAELGRSISNWLDVYEPETAPPELSRTLAAMSDVEIDIYEWAPEAEAPQGADTAEVSAVLDVLPDFVRQNMSQIVGLPLAGTVWAQQQAYEILADVTDEPIDYWQNLPRVHRLAVVVALLIALAAILTPEPVSTAAGVAIISGIALWQGVAINRGALVNRADEFRDAVSIPE